MGELLNRFVFNCYAKRKGFLTEEGRAELRRKQQERQEKNRRLQKWAEEMGGRFTNE